MPSVEAGQGYRGWVVYCPLRRQEAWGTGVGPKRRDRERKRVYTAVSAHSMKRILVVEDEKHLADGLRFNLEAEDYEVEVVDNGEAALERLVSQSAPFDIVVLDVMLPGISGFDVVAEMRKAGSYIPTLIL